MIKYIIDHTLYLITSIISLLISSLAFYADAQDNVALPFIRIVRDPAAEAMGFAGAASNESIAYSSFRNASMIPFFEKSGDISFSWQNWAPDAVKSNNFNLGAGFRLAGGKFGFAIGGAYQSGERYDDYDENGESSGTFTPYDMLVNLGVGFLITKDLSAGINARYARQTIEDNLDYDAFSGDIFLSYRISDFSISAGVVSVGAKVKDSEGNKYDLPSSATLAGDWHKIFAERHSVRVDVDADYFFCGDFTFALGAEYSFSNVLFARAGYHIGADDAVLPSFATLGLGVHLKAICLDFAYLTGNDILKNTITVGVRIKF